MSNIEFSATARDLVTCNVCEENDTSPYVSDKNQTVWLCRSCGTAFTHPQPSDTISQYGSNYFELYAKRREFRLKRADRRLRRIELLTSPGRVLDIGCSLGYFVEAAEKRGWEAYGIEISSYAAGVAAKAGFKVKAGTLEEAGYDNRFFDCVTMWDVLEHIPNPTSHLLEVRRILRHGGIVVTGTPNLAHPVAIKHMKNAPPSWRHFKPAEHLYYFTPNSLKMLLRKCGFRIVEPPLFPRKISLTTAVMSELASRILPVNDVMVIYGVLDG